MRIKEIIRESPIDYPEDDYERELVWDHLREDGIIDKSVIIFNRIKSVTSNFSTHPLDVLDLDDVVSYLNQVQTLLAMAEDKIPSSKIISVLMYLRSYLGTITYPE